MKCRCAGFGGGKGVQGTQVGNGGERKSLIEEKRKRGGGMKSISI